jgi:hypothetical protein
MTMEAKTITVEILRDASGARRAVGLSEIRFDVRPRFVFHIFDNDCESKVDLVAVALTNHLQTEQGQREAGALVTHLKMNPCKDHADV